MSENERIVQEYCDKNDIDFDAFMDGIDFLGSNHKISAPAEIIRAAKLYLKEVAEEMLGI